MVKRKQAPTDIAIVVRLCYYLPGYSEERRRWRFRFFAEVILPTLKAQTVPADIWVWVAEPHVAEATAMFPGCHIFTVDLDAPSRTFPETSLRGYPWSAVRGMPMYRHQVLVDSDDFISPRFIEKGLAVLNRCPLPDPVRTLATHYPIAVDYETQKVYAMPQWRHWASAFVVFRQRVDPATYVFIWDHPHIHLHRLTDWWAHVPAGEAVVTLHEHNNATRLGDWPEVPRPAWLPPKKDVL